MTTNPGGGPGLGRALPPEPERLVTIEAQREFDLFTGVWAERVFVKLYVAARTSGLLAAISDRDWKTLCTLATYMDGEGFCYPSQAELARALGCSRQMANERVKSLAEFRFQGQPVLLVVKPDRTQAGTWARNGYRVLSLANLAIYESDEGVNDSNSDSAPPPVETVSSALDTVGCTDVTVSSCTGTVWLDTNKKLINQLELEGSNIRMASPSDESVSTTGAPPAAERVPLVEAIAHWRNRGSLPDPTPGQVSAARTAIPAPPETSKPRPHAARRRQADPDYQAIQSIVRDVARELNDRAPLGATTTRAYNLWRRAGIPLDPFVDHLYTARAIVKERTAAIRSSGTPAGVGFPVKHSVGYFFAVLEDLIGLRGNPPGTPAANPA